MSFGFAPGLWTTSPLDISLPWPWLRGVGLNFRTRAARHIRQTFAALRPACRHREDHTVGSLGFPAQPRAQSEGAAAGLRDQALPRSEYLGTQTSTDRRRSSEVLPQATKDGVINGLIPAFRKDDIDVVLETGNVEGLEMTW